MERFGNNVYNKQERLFSVTVQNSGEKSVTSCFSQKYYYFWSLCEQHVDN